MTECLVLFCALRNECSNFRFPNISFWLVRLPVYGITNFYHILHVHQEMQIFHNCCVYSLWQDVYRRQIICHCELNIDLWPNSTIFKCKACIVLNIFTHLRENITHAQELSNYGNRKVLGSEINIHLKQHNLYLLKCFTLWCFTVIK
jgi:hypothetical protein